MYVCTCTVCGWIFFFSIFHFVSLCTNGKVACLWVEGHGLELQKQPLCKNARRRLHTNIVLPQPLQSTEPHALELSSYFWKISIHKLYLSKSPLLLCTFSKCQAARLCSLSLALIWNIWSAICFLVVFCSLRGKPLHLVRMRRDGGWKIQTLELGFRFGALIILESFTTHCKVDEEIL